MCSQKWLPEIVQILAISHLDVRSPAPRETDQFLYHLFVGFFKAASSETVNMPSVPFAASTACSAGVLDGE